MCAPKPNRVRVPSSIFHSYVILGVEPSKGGYGVPHSSTPILGGCQVSIQVESPILCSKEPVLVLVELSALKMYSSSHKQARCVPQTKSVADQSPILPSARPTPMDPALGLSCHVPVISSGKH